VNLLKETVLCDFAELWPESDAQPISRHRSCPEICGRSLVGIERLKIFPFSSRSFPN
jgi:hypothetical protein